MTHSVAGQSGMRPAPESFASAGGRAPVVLVPGLGVARYLRPVARALAGAGHPTTLLRPPGWPGRADGRPGPATPTQPAILGAAVADWLGGQTAPVVLVGQSVGSQIAAHAAALAPGSVRLLVLQGPTFDPGRRTTVRVVARWVVNAPHERLRLGLTQLPEWREVGAAHLLRLLRGFLDDDLGATLAAVRAPVLVVVGADDRLSRRAWSASLGTLPLRVLPGGHTAVYDDPAALVAAVDDALERCG